MFKLNIIIAILFSTVFMEVIHGQEWPKIYGNSISVIIRDLKESYDYGYTLIGYNYKNNGAPQYGMLTKTDINGEILWEKKFGDGNYMVGLINSSLTSDNGIIISGAISKYNQSGKLDPFFIKLNFCGEVEWCQILLSPEDNYGMDIIQLNDSSYIGMLKYYGGDYQNIRISLVKMDSLGNPIWIKHLAQEDPLIHNEEGNYLLLTSDDNYLVSGRCYYPGVRPFWILTDEYGEQLWDIKYGNTTGLAYQTIEIDSGVFINAGIYSGSGRPQTPSIFKFNNDGQLLSHHYLLGDTIVGGSAHSIASYNDSTLIIGIQWREVAIPVDEGFSEVFITDTSGLILKRRLLLEENKVPRCVVRTHDNKILVSGNYVVDDNWDIYLWKLNSDLEDDTLYTQSFTYDSLCPYQITSDTIDLECGLYVAIEDIPLKEEYDKKLKIWPNPAGEIVNCQLSIVDFRFSIVLEIYNFFGGKMEEMEISPGQDHLQINVSTYPAGLYVAVLRSTGKILGREKFVVIK